MHQDAAQGLKGADALREILIKVGFNARMGC